MSDLTPEERLEFFYEPCKTKEELKNHIKAFLKIDLPDNILDEESTSTPMDFVWTVYNVMRTGEGPTRHVVAAARNTAKTLCASIIRYFGIVHFRRSGTHLAANLDQSRSASTYLGKFLAIPETAPFISVNNSREIRMVGLPANSYTKNGEAVLRIAVATVGGVNSQRGSLNTRDELDLVPPAILSESAFIADPTQDEHRFDPIEINLSSRKTNSGPIQTLLDEAEKKVSRRLMAHKWSTVDWMQSCTPFVRAELQEQARVPQSDGTIESWINIETLKPTFGRENYEALPDAEKSLQREYVAKEACKVCPAFAVCLGRSVKQTGKSKMLRGVNFIDDLITSVKSPDKLIAQALNWKPESSAVIFRFFNRRRHFLSYRDSWEWLFGEQFNPQDLPPEEMERIRKSGAPHELAGITPSKADIYKKLCEVGWTIHYGVDWGFNPDMAVCLVIAYHKRQNRAFILHMETALNHSNQDWADYIRDHIFPEFPCDLVCPDMADKSSPTYFRKQPSIPCIDTKPMRVETGVSQVRGLLWNVRQQREMMVVLDDGPLGKNEFIAECFEKWTHRKTPLGFDFTKFDGDSPYTHPLDSLRYGLDPFLDIQTARFAANQPRTHAQVIKEAGEGKKEAIEELQAAAFGKAEQALTQHLFQEHGLADIHAAARRMQEEEANKTKVPEQPKKGGGALKFRF